MIFKQPILFLLSFLLAHQMQAQKPRVTIPHTLDSLVLFLKIQPIDTLYAIAMKDCAFQYMVMGQYKQADSLRKQLERLYDEIHYVRITYYVPFIQATLAYHQNDDQGALKYYLKALRAVEANQSKFRHQALNDAFNNVAAGFDRVDKPDSVMHYSLQAIHVQDQFNFRDAGPYVKVADVLSKYKKYGQALPYYEKALAISQSEDNTIGMSIAENKLGNLYDNLNNRKKATAYYQQGLTHAEEAGYLLLQTDLLANLGQNAIDEKQYARAEAYFKRGEKLCRELENDQSLQTNLHNQGELYREQKQFDLAKTYYTQSLELAKKMKDQEALYKDNYALAELYEETRNYARACSFLKEAAVAKDSIFQAETADKMQDLLLAYETEKKQHQIVVLNQENRTKSLELTIQQRNQYYLLAGIGCLLVIAGLIFRSYRLKRETSRQLGEKNQTLESTNRQLALLNHRLHESNESKTKLFSILSHDLRSPISSLFQLLNLQKENPHLLKEEQRQRHEARISQTAEELLETLEDLLLWSKSQMEYFTPSVELINLNHFLLEALPLYQPLASQKDIQLLQDCPEALQIQADLNFLKIIVRNLLSNAIKFTPEGGQIDLKASHDKGQICLSVQDNGMGMTSQQIASLFDWQRVRGTQSGLGLQLTREFTEKLGGRLMVESEPGKGTCFSVVFEATVLSPPVSLFE